MKKYWITILSAALATGAFAQGPALYNNGAGLFISPGTQVRVNGDFENLQGSTLNNQGIITATGNVLNLVPMTQADAGELHLEGDGAQVITGAPVYATSVVVNTPAGITVSTPFRVSGTMAFVSGVLTNTDPANAIVFGPDATTSLASPPYDASHVNGFVRREGAGTFLFPVGNGLSYQPVGVNLTSNTGGLVARYQAGDAGDGPFATTGSSSTPLVARNAQEYWTLAPVGTAQGTVSIYWDDYNNTGIGNIADLTVAHLVNGSWVNEGANNAQGITDAGVVTSNIINSWSPFTLGSIASSSPLPVRLADFTARWAENRVALEWRVSDAKDFSHFEVERSMDAVQYQKIGDVAFEGQAAFRFSDDHPLASSWLSGERYYRLKMVDTDGTFAYSKVRSVEVGTGDNGLVAYPNPSRDVLHLNFDRASQGKAEATIISMAGRSQLKKSLTIKQGSAALDTSSLAPGVYLLSVQVDGRDRLLKFVKQ